MKYTRLILILLTLLTLGFIWGHSMVPKDKSSAESGLVKEIIEDIIQGISRNDAVTISEKLIRKSAHFLEYAVLGAEVTLIFICGTYAKDAIRIPFRIYIQTGVFTLCTALIDESIQAFTGRWPSLFDVSLDFIGSTATIWIVILFYKRFKTSKSKESEIL